MTMDDVALESSSVVVYAYRYYDRLAEAFMVSAHKAPRRLISEHLGGEVLEGTAETVSADELGSDGCYRRVATGWGVLN